MKYSHGVLAGYNIEPSNFLDGDRMPINLNKITETHENFRPRGSTDVC